MPLHPNAKEADRIAYERRMFLWLARRIEVEWRTSSQQEQNLLLEGLLLHARILYEFFVKKPRRDDVSARQFFDIETVWITQADVLCPCLRVNWPRLNKMLAHLTYSRLSEEREWPFETIRDEVEAAWNLFMEALPADRRLWFEARVPD